MFIIIIWGYYKADYHLDRNTNLVLIEAFCSHFGHMSSKVSHAIQNIPMVMNRNEAVQSQQLVMGNKHQNFEQYPTSLFNIIMIIKRTMTKYEYI